MVSCGGGNLAQPRPQSPLWVPELLPSLANVCVPDICFSISGSTAFFESQTSTANVLSCSYLKVVLTIWGQLFIFPGSVLHIQIGRGNGNPLQYFCLENSMDKRSLAGSVGSQKSDMTNWACMLPCIFVVKVLFDFLLLICLMSI